MPRLPLLLFLTLVGSSATGVEVQVIANRASGITALSADDLADFYLARRTKLPNGKPVTVLTRSDQEESSAFLDKYLDRTPASFSAEWKRIVFTGKGTLPKEASTDEEMVDLVRRTPGAIGYVAVGTDVSGVEVVKIAK